MELITFFAPDLAVLINPASFLRRQDSSHLIGQTGEIGVIQYYSEQDLIID